VEVQIFSGAPLLFYFPKIISFIFILRRLKPTLQLQSLL